MLVAAAVTGSSYTFGIYSESLKSQYGLTQSQLEVVAISCFCVGFITFIPGLIGDRLGPSRAIMLGGCLQFTAFTTFWAISTKIIDLGGMNTWTVLILLR